MEDSSSGGGTQRTAAVLGSKGPKGATCTSGLAASGTCMTCTACKASVPMPTSKVA